jgi:hypothetical protein
MDSSASAILVADLVINYSRARWHRKVWSVWEWMFAFVRRQDLPYPGKPLLGMSKLILPAKAG